MADELLEKHLLAGLDERERGFSRTVDVARRDGAFRATFRYEALVVENVSAESAAGALVGMVWLLQERGYRQIRTRLAFIGGTYLGSQELWIEYADPEPPPESAGRLMELLSRLWRALTRRSRGAA